MCVKLTKEERKELKFKAKTEKFLALIEKLKVMDMPYKEVMANTIKFKISEGLTPEEYGALASNIRGAMFGYIRHELVINYQEALKLLNYHPDRDNLYPLLKVKANKLVDEKYEKIGCRRADAVKLIKKLTSKGKTMEESETFKTDNYNGYKSGDSIYFEHKELGDMDSVDVYIKNKEVTDFDGAMMVDPEIQEWLKNNGYDISEL